MTLFKWLLVGGLALAGGVAMLAGSGSPLPFLSSRTLEIFGVSTGLVFICAALAVAYCWEISESSK